MIYRLKISVFLETQSAKDFGLIPVTSAIACDMKAGLPAAAA